MSDEGWGGGGLGTLRWINTVDTKGLGGRDLLFSSTLPSISLNPALLVCGLSGRSEVPKSVVVNMWGWGGGLAESQKEHLFTIQDQESTTPRVRSHGHKVACQKGVCPPPSSDLSLFVKICGQLVLYKASCSNETLTHARMHKK